MMKTPVRIAIADDHPVVVDAYTAHLQRLQGVEVACACMNGTKLIESLRETPCDIAVTDFSMGYGNGSVDGFNLLEKLVRLFPSTHIVVVSAQNNPGVVLRAMEIGARAFVSKADKASEVSRACAYVMGGGDVYYSPTVHGLLMSVDIAAFPMNAPTQKEMEVVRLFASGMRLSEIGAKLGRALGTVSSQKTSAMHKLGVSTNTDLIRYAYENGLI